MKQENVKIRFKIATSQILTTKQEKVLIKVVLITVCDNVVTITVYDSSGNKKVKNAM